MVALSCSYYLYLLLPSFEIPRPFCPSFTASATSHTFTVIVDRISTGLTVLSKVRITKITTLNGEDTPYENVCISILLLLLQITTNLMVGNSTNHLIALKNETLAQVSLGLYQEVSRLCFLSSLEERVIFLPFLTSTGCPLPPSSKPAKMDFSLILPFLWIYVA